MRFDRSLFSRRAAQPALALLALLALIATLLVAAETLVLTAHHPHVRLPMHSRHTLALTEGLHNIEQDARGGYRWSSARSRLVLPWVVQGGVPLLLLNVGPAPPQQAPSRFDLALGSEHGFASSISVATDPQGRARRYRLLVPPAAHRSCASLVVRLHSRTVVVPPDTRAVALRLESVALHHMAPRGAPLVIPKPHLLLLQTLLLALWTLLVRMLAGNGRGNAARAWLRLTLTLVASLLLLAALLLLLFALAPLLMATYLVRLCVASALLLGLTAALLPLALRHRAALCLGSAGFVRLLWGIVLLACMIRLVGSLYPLFQAYDLLLNVARLLRTLGGSLVDTNNSIEFRNGVTVYPSGPYLLFLPALLAHIPPTLAVQGGVALIDGAAAFGIAALARMLGASRRATLFAVLLYAAIPINLTALWFGLSAQVFGQALMLPLVLALLAAFRQPARARAWWLFAIFVSMAYLTHIGVTIIAAAWLGIAWLALLLRRTLPMPAWWNLTRKLLLSGMIGLALVYSSFLALKLEQAFKVSEKVMTSGYVPAYSLISRGFQIAFHELSFALLLPALLLLLARRRPRGGQELLGAWVATVALFWAVEMLTALQVRYIYFLTPLACIGVALLLDRLAARLRWWRMLAWAIVLLLLAQGCAVWYTSAFFDEMMAVSPLLR